MRLFTIRISYRHKMTFLKSIIRNLRILRRISFLTLRFMSSSYLYSNKLLSLNLRSIILLMILTTFTSNLLKTCQNTRLRTLSLSILFSVSLSSTSLRIQSSNTKQIDKIYSFQINLLRLVMNSQMRPFWHYLMKM